MVYKDKTSNKFLLSVHSLVKAHFSASFSNVLRTLRNPLCARLKRLLLAVVHGFRHNELNLSDLKARGLSFKVRKTKGSEPQLRRTGYEKV